MGYGYTMKLRPYQEKIITETRALMANGNKSILIVSPCASGKTVLVANMLNSAGKKGKRSWFLVHRRELIQQSSQTFNEMRVKHGAISPHHHPEFHHSIQIASIQTVARRMKTLKPPDLMIFDEAHHTPAGSWNKIFREFPNAFRIGLTATPTRLDGRGLKDWFPVMVQGPTVRQLTEQGYLSPYKLYAPSRVSLSGVHTRMGDYVRSDLEVAMDKPSITGNAIQHYIKYMGGKRAVVFCASVKHSEHVAEEFNANKIPAAHVDGETSTSERDKAISRFREGELKILSNVDIFGEGFDIPSMEGAILLRPTQSLSLYTQQCGRALRTYPGKECAIILDHSNNCQRHGLPDEEREWTLEDRERKRKGDQESSSVKLCPMCFGAQFPGKPVCIYCGHLFEVKPRKIEELSGELTEINASNFKRQAKQEQGQTKSLQALIELGKQRGYKHPYGWARIIFNARQKKRVFG